MWVWVWARVGTGAGALGSGSGAAHRNCEQPTACHHHLTTTNVPITRLFRTLQNMQKILVALQNSIPGVANAFAILFVIMSIYAILGVEFFGNGQIDFDCGTDYFDSYSESMLTLTQVLTGDSWAECIARPCIVTNAWASLYYLSFYLVAVVMMMNIAVAVLLEQFVLATEDFEKELAEQSKAEQTAIIAAALDGDTFDADEFSATNQHLLGCDDDAATPPPAPDTGKDNESKSKAKKSEAKSDDENPSTSTSTNKNKSLPSSELDAPSTSRPSSLGRGLSGRITRGRALKASFSKDTSSFGGPSPRPGMLRSMSLGGALLRGSPMREEDEDEDEDEDEEEEDEGGNAGALVAKTKDRGGSLDRGSTVSVNDTNADKSKVASFERHVGDPHDHHDHHGRRHLKTRKFRPHFKLLAHFTIIDTSAGMNL